MFEVKFKKTFVFIILQLKINDWYTNRVWEVTSHLWLLKLYTILKLYSQTLHKWHFLDGLYTFILQFLKTRPYKLTRTYTLMILAPWNKHVLFVCNSHILRKPDLAVFCVLNEAHTALVYAQTPAISCLTRE